MNHSERGCRGESMAGWDCFPVRSTPASGTAADCVERRPPGRRNSSLDFSDPIGYSGAVRAAEGTMDHPEPATTINP